MMKNVITIKAGAVKYSELFIHPEKAFDIGLARKKYGYICFGNQKHYVNIKMNDEISKEIILLSQKLIYELHLPDYPIYEVCVNKNEINIGPYIGLLMSEEDKNLTTSRLNRLMVYVREYSKIHGAIVVFALNKVDMANRLIEGYCYNPSENCWKKGIFPYPSSIYRTIGLSKKWKNHFLSAIGDKIFNNPYFSKWDMYKWFSVDEQINNNIPHTVLYQSHQDVLDLLARYGKVYIKPVSGLQGRRVVQASMENKAFVFKYRETGENCKVELKNENEAIEFLQKRFYHGRYLIQKAIDLLQYNGRIIDFRCVMQKNQSDMWICKAVIGRCGDRESIVSNISNGGTAFPVIKMLKKAIPSSQDNVLLLKEKMESFAIAVCNTLDECGINCGNLGVDVGIDIQGNLWLIEINNRDPDHTIALNINDKQLYYTLKTGQLFYAKSLAGFSNSNDKSR